MDQIQLTKFPFKFSLAALHAASHSPILGKEGKIEAPPGWNWWCIGRGDLSGMAMVETPDSRGYYRTVDFRFDGVVRVWLHKMADPKAVCFHDISL